MGKTRHSARRDATRHARLAVASLSSAAKLQRAPLAASSRDNRATATKRPQEKEREREKAGKGFIPDHRRDGTRAPAPVNKLFSVLADYSLKITNGGEGRRINPIAFFMDCRLVLSASPRRGYSRRPR